MVKTKGPAISHDASGKLAAALIFSKSAKGSYLKAFAKPKQPRTQPQIAVRAMTTWLSKQWSTLGPAAQTTWEEPAKAKLIARYHAFMGYNQQRWTNFKPPTQTWPAAEAIVPAALGSWTAIALYRETQLKLRNQFGIGLWGWAVFRQHDLPYTPSLNTIKLFATRSAGTWHYFKDSPVTVGSYRYMRWGMSDDGVWFPSVDFRRVTIT